MAELIDKTYGEALFQLSLEEGKVEQYADEVRRLYPRRGQTEGTIVEDLGCEVIVQLINGKEVKIGRASCRERV